MVFGEAFQRIDGPSRQQPEVGRSWSKIHFADKARQGVEETACEALEKRRRSYVVDALRLNYVVAGVLQPQHFGNQGRRMLAIPVERNDGIARGGINSGAQGSLVSEVTTQMDYGDSRIFQSELIKDGRRLVVRAVVDVDVTSLTSGRQRCGIKHFVEANQAGLLVVERYDEIDGRHGAQILCHVPDQCISIGSNSA